MNEHEFLSKWQHAKLNQVFYRLNKEASCEFEFKGAFGNPSSYAFVRFQCFPSNTLSYKSVAKWPDSVTLEEREDMHFFILGGIIDALFQDMCPYRGCHIVLESICWDNVGSSGKAFYKATKSAMQQILDKQNWEMVIPD